MEPIRVLVVDDDDALLDMMSLHLRKKGFQVECAKDGFEAVQMLRSSGPFSVMVTDLMMPGLSGLELLRRARKLDPLIEVIVITAAGSVEMAISALRESGAYDYLTKPLGMIGELSLAVERAASHRELRLDRESMRGSLLNGARRLEDILTSTGVAIIAANEKNELVVASPAAVRLLNQRPENGKPQKGQIPAIFLRLLKGWQALGNNRIVWVEVEWPNGKTKLIRLAPMSLGNSVGWVMVVRDVTYMKKLETFIFRDFAKVATQIRQPMEKVEMLIADLETNLNGGNGDPREQIRQLRDLFEMVQDGSKDLFSLSSNAPIEDKKGEDVSLTAFLKKMQTQQGTKLVSNARLHLNWEIAEDIPEKMLDHSVLAQLFHHLLRHADLHSHEAGEIEFSHWAKDDSIWFGITDTRSGGGEIDFNTSPLLLDGSKLKELDQAQIEFAVVKSLVKELGGQVWVSQTEGGGLVIAIRFKQHEEWASRELD